MHLSHTEQWLTEKEIASQEEHSRGKLSWPAP